MLWNSNWMTRTLALLAVAAVALTVPASAQTPEGTIITNTATVNYEDTTGRAYTPASASVSITVAFKAGLLTVAADGTVYPASPSNADTIAFTINNTGNGVDTVQVTESMTVAGIMTNITYRLNGAAVYLSLGDLNTALASLQLAGITGSAQIQVIYDVPDGQGGQSTVYSLTATSVRDNTMQSTGQTTVAPPSAYAVVVTPDSTTPAAERLPGGAPYQFTFYVRNAGNISDTYTLAATNSGAAIVVGTFSPASPVTIASGDSVAVTVDYTINEVAAGATDRLTLTATSTTQPPTDDGFLDMVVVRPTVAIAKAVFAPDSLTALAGNVQPGDIIWYRVEVQNPAGANARNAQNVVVSDSLPAELTFSLLAPDTGSDWTLAYNAGTRFVTATLGVALAPGASRHFWIQAQVN
ncbi:MAG: hypothetical protein OEO20_09620 [Gemmatimonadota bacterium]|nr:hypothetical protein [Gemmatimonadota bacterium]MDH3367354.1 hypothetical protein [Gemmatimonadota bacterium]MDH3478550.1 hypothetical protein [Gemmatimonadota bacterium]MDH3569743.1 hypothetical protein [Gemmatimonadota bacterium]MDH5549323.1 hypothetical protein [Gemmatimonadota bacterium]